MEQFHHLIGNRVNAGKIRAFEAIAVATRQREVVENSYPTVLLCNDVIVVEGKFRELRREVTILATMLRPFTHSLLEGCVHLCQAAAALLRKDRRALAFRNSNARPTFK